MTQPQEATGRAVPGHDRERTVTSSFVSLAGRLAQGYDAVDLLGQLTADCAALLDIDSAGLLLANTSGVLNLLAASSEASRDLELLQLQSEEGPCLDCYRGGTAITVPDLTEETERWPRFTAVAAEAGFVSVHAVPMRLRNRRLGALGLFGTKAGTLNDDDLSLGQALADVASISLVQDQAAADSRAVTDQLQKALNSRVILEQAKGLLAQQGDLDMAEAFVAIRQFAYGRRERLTDVARALVDRDLSAATLLAEAHIADDGGPAAG